MHYFKKKKSPQIEINVVYSLISQLYKNLILAIYTANLNYFRVCGHDDWELVQDELKTLWIIVSSCGHVLHLHKDIKQQCLF